MVSDSLWLLAGAAAVVSCAYVDVQNQKNVARTAPNLVKAKINNTKMTMGCPPQKEGWKAFQVNLHDFGGLPTTKNHYVELPAFSCNGHDWRLHIYPGGRDGADEGYVSIYLHHESKGSITVSYELQIIDKFGKKKKAFRTSHTHTSFQGMGRNWGVRHFIKRSDILDESHNILDSNGTLTIIVSMKEEKPTTAFIPPNPINCMRLNDDTADVCFEISSSTGVNDHGRRRKKAKKSTPFRAHSCILKTYAHMLAELVQNEGDVANITGVDPKVFRLLLGYVYGESVNWEENKSLAKDVIEAADKYEILNLKIEAEVAYVESTTITVDNAIDNLLYADSMKCALIEEAVFDFIAQNGDEVKEKLSVDDIPGDLAKDILASLLGTKKKAMRVSEMRRKLYEKGLPVDGTRKMMIEALKASP
ncbi:hypothetical protein ACHAWC_002249 [Mediolabrus comicus]